MRTCRFRRAGREHYGVLDGASVRALTAEPWAGGLPEGPAHPLSEVALLAPVQPSKVVCIGRNYRAHAQELGHEVPREPLLFIKPSTSVIGPGDEIRLPAASQEVHHEAELAIVMGRALTCGSPITAREAIFGFTCLDDVTARDIQRAEQHFTRAKSFDTFCPIGPCIETALDPMDASVVCRVNGAERQRGSTRELVVDAYALVAFVSSVMTLLPGDVVSTGTPAGVGPLRRGDWVEVEVPGIGILKNPVV
ncbi:MAG TPA: fumarylacetoacetate hydrolase family protein [Anaeromyxobacteraceae bacterium]|nr:fumarylacetoacetate hydrolase family protein [Anaeromyxobacteraceae bacterium]